MSLALNTLLVKEHVGMFKAANNFDIFDPQTGRVAMTCREEKLGVFTRLLRFTDYKRYTPFDIEVKTADGETVVRAHRGATIWRSRVKVEDGRGQLLGTFRQKMLSIGGAFDVLDPTDQVICTLRGKWTGWDFRFESAGAEVAHVTKKWAGIGKELFTSADNYVLSISPSLPVSGPARPLILAAVLCIDMVLKE